MVDVGNGNARIGKNLLERLTGAVQEILGNALEFHTGQRLVEEEWVLVLVNRDVRQVDASLLRGGKLNLGFLSSLTQTLQRHLVLGQVNAV